MRIAGWKTLHEQRWPWLALLPVIIAGYVLNAAATLWTYVHADLARWRFMDALAHLGAAEAFIIVETLGVLTILAMLLHFARVPGARIGPNAALGLMSTCLVAALLWYFAVAHLMS